MLDRDVIFCSGKKEFDKKVKSLFVNMTNNTRTLHKTYTKGCQYSKCCNKFITFNSMYEVEHYEETHRDATYFKRCGNCFKKR